MIEESIVNVAVDNLPAYFKYRYTFVSNVPVEEQRRIANLIFLHILEHYSHDGRVVMGVEHYTKGMVPTKPHVHIHFVSKCAAKNMRDVIGRKFDFKGRCQTCKAEVLVDEFKFWRYPLKQQKSNTKVFSRSNGFSEEEITRLRDVAYECWKQSAEVFIRKEEAKLERTSRDRLFAYLDGVQISDLRDAMIKAFRYYAEHEDNFNITTVKGYVHIYVMKKGIISVEEMVDKYGM